VSPISRKSPLYLAFPTLMASLGWAAPALAEEGGWSLKPRGRIQLDAGVVEASDGVEAAAPGALDFDAEVRRLYLGVDGRMPGDLGFRIEGDFSGGTFTWTDTYLTWDPSKRLNLTLGNQKPFWGLEELTSDLFPSFMERAAAHTAFGNERRLGLSATYTTGDVMMQGGAFLDDLDSIFDGTDNGHSFDARAVYMPRLAGGQLHLGASAHYRELDGGTSVRYGTRPFLHTVDTKFVDTGKIDHAANERGYGLEFAYITGPFHVTGETRWQHVGREGGLPEPTFFGGYAELGYFLTKGDSRGYKGGIFQRTTPANPLGQGGFGALQLNLRYDYLDLDDAGIAGGRQDSYGVSLAWTPTAHTRFIANYARLQFDGAAIAADGSRSYGADAFGMRAQFDF